MLEKYRQGFDIFYWCPQFDIFNVMMYILFWLFTSFVIGLFLHVPGLCRGHFHGQSVARSQTPGRGEDSPCNKQWKSDCALLYSRGQVNERTKVTYWLFWNAYSFYLKNKYKGCFVSKAWNAQVTLKSVSFNTIHNFLSIPNDS